MSKSTKNLDNAAQPDLFEGTNFPGSGDDDAMLRATLTDAIKRCAKKREQIAEEMSALVGREVSVAMLNAFTADSKENHRWPAAWSRAFCQVTNDWRLLRAPVERAGFVVITRRDARLLEIAREHLSHEQSARRLHAMTEQILSEAQGQ